LARRRNSQRVNDIINLGQATPQMTQLSLWLQNRFDPSWQPVETLFAATGRSPIRLRSTFNLRSAEVIKRFKQIDCLQQLNGNLPPSPEYSDRQRALMMLGRSLALLEPLELLAYDRLLTKRPVETIDPRILVVEITESDSDCYPLSDESLVEAIDILEQHQPAAIGIDLHRAQTRGTSGYQNWIERITLTQLRSEKIPPQLISDRIVLIGYTTSVARDNFETPYGTMPGVWIHTHMTSQLICAVEDDRTLIWSLPLWGDWLWILGWSILTIVIMLMLREKPVLYSILALIILTVGAELFIFGVDFRTRLQIVLRPVTSILQGI